MTLYLLGTTLVTAVILRAMGQPWWCSCGLLVPWSWDIWTPHNSQHLIDPYFFSHLLHGVLFYAVLFLIGTRAPMVAKLPLRLRFSMAIIVEAGWEILENSPIIIERYRTATISLDYFGDSIANSAIDIAACAIGFLFTARVKWWWSLVAFLLVELALLLTIRDCLTLNIVMLTYPVEAIKTWQSG
jgi:hypothetical protein